MSDDAGAEGGEGLPGTAIINASWAGTGLYSALAVLGAIAPDTFAVPAAVVSVVLFLIGCVVFLVAYWRAVQRSRTDLIGIGGLYFLAGSAPRAAQVPLLTSLGVEVVVAIVTSSIRLYTALAFGFLVPVYGLGLCGLWGARYGTFPPRPAPQPKKRARTETSAVSSSDGEPEPEPDT